MRYNSEALEIKVVISRNGLLFKDIKISLGLLKDHAQPRCIAGEHPIGAIFCNTEIAWFGCFVKIELYNCNLNTKEI